MRGFCGWLEFDSTVAPATEVVARMAGDDLTAGIESGRNWALKFDSRRAGGMSLHCGDDGFSIVEGNPTSSNKEFLTLVNRYGVAQACQIMYRKFGADFISALRGPFCLAISLDNESRVVLALDRVGIQPIYFSQTGGGLAFASRLDHLHGCPKVDLTTDPQSIYDYLYYHVIPSPNTIFRNVKSLTPGSYFEALNGSSQIKRYWQVEYSQENADADLGLLKNEFREILRQCVESEAGLTPDVGCFLSGGTDSSTLAGVLGDVINRPVSTYSIGFDQKGFDEMEYARMAARHFDTDHHEYYVTPEDILKLVPKISQTYGQPFGNSSVIPTYYCARMAQADGKKRILGGDGGDELFGGNERYATQVLFSYYGRVPEKLRQIVIEPLLNGFPFGDKIMPISKLRRYVDQAQIPMPDRLQTYGYLDFLGRDTMLEPDFVESVDSEKPLRYLQQLYGDSRAEHLINKMLAVDLKLTLGDNDLPKVSRMCELAGISAGYPFLHEPLIDFAARLPVDMKVRGLNIRWFFKEALRGYLPEGIIKKKKHGFGLPFGDWLVSHNGLRSMAFDSLESLKKRHIVRADFIDNLRDHLLVDHSNYYGGLIWVLMILEQWFDRNASSR